ncbi:MAG: hypothetical protein PUF17_10455 [Lactimicrobium massiliense]|nr:hypothetical protein [Lactimicrobium massiliense]MDD6561366.1 hypothetical protein [Lactimicrobium massiliense]
MAEKEKKVIKGITKSGFSFEVDEAVFNDAELLEDLAALDDGDVMKYPKVVKKILGTKQKAKLYDHVRDENGIVPLDKLGDEILDIFNANRKGKN